MIHKTNEKGNPLKREKICMHDKFQDKKDRCYFLEKIIATLVEEHKSKKEISITWKRMATLVGGIPHSAKIVIA